MKVLVTEAAKFVNPHILKYGRRPDSWNVGPLIRKVGTALNCVFWKLNRIRGFTIYRHRFKPRVIFQIGSIKEEFPVSILWFIEDHRIYFGFGA